MLSSLTLVKIALLLDEEEMEIRSRERRRIWVHNLLKKRRQEGEFHTLFRELLDDETKFYQYFRMSSYDFSKLLASIEESIRKNNTTFRQSITPAEKLACCLRFLATGDSFRTIAFSYRLGHSTVHATVHEVCQAIINNLLAEYMPIPGRKDWEDIASRFWTLWNFPNCIGCIDGKHVEIVAPANSVSNYKKTFSVVLLALVDADYRFIAVDIGSYGENSDGGIFSTSRLGNALQTGSFDIPGNRSFPESQIVAPHIILGDAAFPLKPYLLRPYPADQVKNEVEKRIFNYRHCHARRVVEKAFGLLAQRFHIYLRKIHSRPGFVEKIILATCILHNYVQKGRACPISGTLPNQDIRSVFSNLERYGINASQSSFQVRDKFKSYLNSPAGSVPWQNNIL